MIGNCDGRRILFGHGPTIEACEAELMHEPQEGIFHCWTHQWQSSGALSGVVIATAIIETYDGMVVTVPHTAVRFVNPNKPPIPEGF